MKLLVLNGPNLNMLGIREPEIYGNKTYQDLEEYIFEYCKKKDIDVDIKQTNDESLYISLIHRANGIYDACLLNPAAWSHYSYAVRDAISSINVPCYEVHLSNIEKREDFRKLSVVKDVCVKTVMGLGFDSYIETIKLVERGI